MSTARVHTGRAQLLALTLAVAFMNAAAADGAAPSTSVSSLFQLIATHQRFGDDLGDQRADTLIGELRVDASARGGAWEAVLRPRARMRHIDTTLPGFVEPRGASFTEAYASVDATPRWQFSLGKRYLAWGPGLLYSPSNRLFPDNGSASPRQEIDGKPMFVAAGTAAGLQLSALLADPYLVEDPRIDRRGVFALLRMEHRATGQGELGWGLVTGGGAGLQPYVGGYGQWGVGDALTLAVEGSASRGYARMQDNAPVLAQDARRWHSDTAWSLRYGLSDGGEWGIEFIENGFHLSDAEREDPRIALLPPSASTQSRYVPRHPLPEGRYLNLQLNLPKLFGRSSWTLFIRHLEGLDGHGRLSFAELGYSATDRLTLFLGLTATGGSAASPLVRAVDRAAYAAAELNF